MSILGFAGLEAFAPLRAFARPEGSDIGNSRSLPQFTGLVTDFAVVITLLSGLSFVFLWTVQAILIVAFFRLDQYGSPGLAVQLSKHLGCKTADSC